MVIAALTEKGKIWEDTIRKQGNELCKHPERLLARKGLIKGLEVERTCKEEPGEARVCRRDRISKGKLMNVGSTGTNCLQECWLPMALLFSWVFPFYPAIKSRTQALPWRTAAHPAATFSLWAPAGTTLPHHVSAYAPSTGLTSMKNWTQPSNFSSQIQTPGTSQSKAGTGEAGASQAQDEEFSPPA